MDDIIYPNVAGSKDDGAGRAAADAFQPKLAKRQAEAKAALDHGPATSDEIAARVGRHWYVVRPRLSELCAMGLAIKTGERGTSAFGGPQTVWRAASKEEVALFNARKAAAAEKGGAQ